MPPTALKQKTLTFGEDEIVIRPLSILELHEAKRIREKLNEGDAFDLMDRIGGLKTVQETVADDARTEERRAAIAAKAADATDPDNYDPSVVFRCGIVSWTYKFPDGTPYPCDEETKLTLDSEGEDVLREILKVSARTVGEVKSSGKSLELARSHRS